MDPARLRRTQAGVKPTRQLDRLIRALDDADTTEATHAVAEQALALASDLLGRLRRIRKALGD